MLEICYVVIMKQGNFEKFTTKIKMKSSIKAKDNPSSGYGKSQIFNFIHSNIFVHDIGGAQWLVVVVVNGV